MAHILIIEDEKPLREAYQTILTTNGHKVEAAADGEAALALLKDQKVIPEVILLDMKLPRVTGLEFLRRLPDEAPDVKKQSTVIIFSNQEDEPEIDEAFKLGAKKYILKAWASPRNLVKVIDETLAK